MKFLNILSSLIILACISLSCAPGVQSSEQVTPVPDIVTPHYDKLRATPDIVLVRDGKAECVIASPSIYSSSAEIIQQAIEKKTGIKVPVVKDTDVQAATPLVTNVIVLGNRNTSAISSQLYDRYYSLADLKYPGPSGYSVRSLHDPYANGNSAILVGGSDEAGVEAGAKALAEHLSGNGNGKDLSTGWVMLTKLGEGVVVPSDINNFEIWEASNRYNSIGYFGWNSISKRMAMYYMTGEPFHAREVIRLSFPDEKALKEIDAIDGERIENKKEPLAGPYHYNSMMLILYWDLIEESPVFNDDERLKVLNSFAKRLEHEGTTPFDKTIYRYNSIPASVGSRHHQWAGLSMYTIGRYFQKYYPNPMWAQTKRAGELVFAPLHEHAYVESHGDAGGYSTGLSPILTYMLLADDMIPLKNGVLATLLKEQEVLMNGNFRDPALNAATLDLLNKTAYVTGDGRWLRYRERTGMNTDVFRLGQSFWPDEKIKPVEPADLAGKWTIAPMAPGMWERRRNGIPLEQSFENISYRDKTNGEGDYILIKGFNAAYSNPYHSLALMELRLDGTTLLSGYNNQVLASADGMVEPVVPMDAALLYRNVTGNIAIAVGRVPLPFTDWKRTIVQRTGEYVVIADNLRFRAGGSQQEMVANIETQWQVPVPSEWVKDGSYLRLRNDVQDSSLHFQLHSSENMDVKSDSRVTSMLWSKNVKNGENRVFYHIIARSGKVSPENIRITDKAALMSLPEQAIAVSDEYENTKGDFVLLGESSLFGHKVTSAGINNKVFGSSVPVDIDWNFESGVIYVSGEKAKLTIATSSALKLDGRELKSSGKKGLSVITVPEGSHEISGAVLSPEIKSSLAGELSTMMNTARQNKDGNNEGTREIEQVNAPELENLFQTSIGGKPVESIIIPSGSGEIFCTATGNRIFLFSDEGSLIRTITTKGNVRVLHWWAANNLLLAGFDNEEVVAYDRNWNAKWTFVSQMDQAVYEAGKPYWFKSRDPGVYGLYSGEFDNGKNRAFVGSACTLEILDENGQLVKRTAAFWGPGRQFLLVDAPDGSKNLLIGRWRNGYNGFVVVNSRQMKAIGRTHNDVPEGHTFIDGWTSMNRYDNFLTDLDGDGKQEIVSAINGTWNRVTIYSVDDKPLYNAQFGPGIKEPRANLRMMDVGDMDGNGKKEIVIGISAGFVNMLNEKAEKTWARLLPSPPTVVKIIPGNTPWICAGCEDGSIYALNSKGEITGRSKIGGKPVDLNIANTEAGKVAVIITETGSINVFHKP